MDVLFFFKAASASETLHGSGDGVTHGLNSDCLTVQFRTWTVGVASVNRLCFRLAGLAVFLSTVLAKLPG
jgi:hypothetical protein